MKKSKKEVKIYTNAKQREFLQAIERFKMFRAGRGTGKTRVLGYEVAGDVTHFPGAKSFLSSSTYSQLLTKTLPEAQLSWKQRGLIEDLHYYIGRKPPAAFIRKMDAPPRKWENIISFWNGHHKECLSMDRPDLARGGSFITGDIDEGLNVKKQAFTKVLVPSVRGHIRYKKHPRYRQIRIYTSVPWKVSAYWIMEFDDWMKQNPDKYKVVEASTMDNIAVLGLDFIEDLRDTLPPLEFQVEVLNQFMMKIPDGFYHKFDAAKHCVSATFDYGYGMKGIEVKGDKDINPNAFIDFSVDFGGRFNCGLAMQYDWRVNTVNVLREFYVKDNEGKVRELVERFCKQYKDHKQKHVRIFGEPRGMDRQPDGEPIFIRMQGYFQKLGWTSEICATKTAESHISRHNLMTEIFEERDDRIPKVRINENYCLNFILVLQTTAIKDDFTKDKSKEKDQDFPQEKAPHFSDAFDNYITQNFPHLLDLDGLPWLWGTMGLT